MLYAVRIGEETYSVEINDLDTRPVVVSVDGEKMDVWPEETAPQPVAGPGQIADAVKEQPSQKTSTRELEPLSNQVTAPIPGVIVEISAVAGKSVNRGDELCVLEAMKMKNSIKAGRAGTIAAIRISTGEHVRHGQILMEYTD